MSNTRKLPVGDALSAIFSYSFKHFPTILKVALIPTVVFFGLMFYLVLPNIIDSMFQLMMIAEEEDPTAILTTLAPMFGMLVLLLPLSLIYYAMILAPLLRNIMYGEQVGFLRLDGLVWRTAAAIVIIYFIMIGIILAAMIPIGIVTALLVSGSEEAAGAIDALVMLFMYPLIFAVMVKTTLILPDIIASGRLRIMPGWRASRGNFWQILLTFIIAYIVITFVTYAAMIVAVIVAMIGLSGNEVLQSIDVETMTPEQLSLIWDTIISSPSAIFALIIYGLASIFSMGAFAAILGTIYRMIVLDGPREVTEG